jgi:agmatinase
MRVSAVHGPLALVHFDTHIDTSAQVFGVKMSHGTIMRRLVEDGHVAPNRYAQVGQRGYWPGEKEFSWQVEHGISHFMHDVRDLSIEAHGLSCEAPPGTSSLPPP